MAKTILGIDIGHDRLKLALVRGSRVLKVASEEMPENLLKEGQITSVETLGELIRTAMKKNGIRANHAAVVLPIDTVYIKNVVLPLMTVDQLEYNLPYEFNDYITDEVKDYVFDYAVQEMNNGQEEPQEESSDSTGFGSDYNEDTGGANMELMAVATRREQLEDLRAALRKAGLRLVKVAPAVCAYISLIRKQQALFHREADEYAVLDLGFEAIRLHMFRQDRYLATRELEIGLSSLDNVLTDVYGVDVHLAHTYLLTNFENCLSRDECLETYQNISVELMRALNFYRFSNPNSVLSDMWICGGGEIMPLINSIRDMLDLELHPGEELVPYGSGIESCTAFVQAIGITMD